MTADDVPIDLIVHTPGGLVLAAEQIALALVRQLRQSDCVRSSLCYVGRHLPGPCR